MINSTLRLTVRLCVVSALGFIASPASHQDVLAQSLSYTSGQPISPAFEGWEEDKDGARYFLFGYMNKNWEEELDVPIGPDNSFSPGDPDRGQPTHFLPRRNRFLFRVRVPAGFSEKDELVWTLTTHGRTTKAYASLRADYLIDDVVKASETGALGAGRSTPTVRANQPPTVRIEGPAKRTVSVGEPLTLVATIADDGIPKGRSREEFLATVARRLQANSPLAALFGGGAGSAASPASAGERPPTAAPAEQATGTAAGSQAAAAPAGAVPPALATRVFLAPPSRITVGKNLGLHLSWFVYRGAGRVRFDPVQIKAWEDTRAGANSPWAPIWFAPPVPADGKITTQVSFESPGTFVLRALADDGALTGGENVTITVTTPSSSR
jgi:hypothetical protein